MPLYFDKDGEVHYEHKFGVINRHIFDTQLGLAKGHQVTVFTSHQGLCPSPTAPQKGVSLNSMVNYWNFLNLKGWKAALKPPLVQGTWFVVRGTNWEGDWCTIEVVHFCVPTFVWESRDNS